MVKLNVPLTPDGAPLSSPVNEFKERPAGTLPEIRVQFEYGGVPPAAANVCAYGTPIIPGVSGDVDVIVIAEGWGDGVEGQLPKH